MSYSYTRISRDNGRGGIFVETVTHQTSNSNTETFQERNFHRSSNFSHSSRPKATAKRQLQDPTIQYDLKVSLEDMYKGCVKNMKVTRNIFSRDGSSRSEVKMLKVNVKPGCKDGAKFVFPKEGDQIPGHIPADIAFVIKDKPHTDFQRDGVNIRYTQKITLKEALCGATIYIPTLDGTIHQVEIDRIIKPNTTQRLAGHGLPNPHMDNKRGDLIICFDVEFPDAISIQNKELLQKSSHYF
uniref:Chaperone DnaJ C-terminal domain-containing protein n=1 Tax=Panagrolaimus sp. ES5 TaxID=591445 RepID=A0AC34F5C3_9BILA